MPPSPKRFYAQVGVVETPDGYCIELDGRDLKTDAKRVLYVPTRKLAEAVAAEWDAQADEIDMASMPLTRLSKTAADRGSIDRDLMIDDILKFSNSDLLCYRATGPDTLVKRQTAGWQPVLDWAEETLGVRLAVSGGLDVLEQPAASLANLESHVEALSDFELVGLARATALLGSVVLAMALFKGHLQVQEAWSLSLLDELWQLEMWGEDEEARARREGLLRDLHGLADFLSSLG